MICLSPLKNLKRCIFTILHNEMFTTFHTGSWEGAFDMHVGFANVLEL